ncbi:MAG: glycosyltransferase [Bacteroidetes bacterium]|nr:glycosyltransferase [Bacteroidota bacterium]
MPRVLRILNRFNLGGPTYNAAYLTKYLSTDFETLLVGGANDPTEKNSEFIVNNLGISPIKIPEMQRAISPLKDYQALQKLKKLIKEFKPDIVHTHASKAGALGRRAAIACKVPVIVHTFHGHVFDSYFSEWKASFYKRLERGLAAKSSGIIAISDIQKEDLSVKYKICPPEKVRVIPLGFDLSKFREDTDSKRFEFRQKYQISDDEIAIGIVGRLVPIKNHKMFLEAFNILKSKSNRKLRAFIIGDGECKEEIQEKSRELGLDFVNGVETFKKAPVTFTSWLTDMDEVNAGMDIIALTSLNEGTPVSLIEAQASGKPIVSTNVGGIENVVMPGKTALLSCKNKPDEFADRLLELTDNDVLRKDFSNNGWEFVKNKFHYTRLVKDMEEYYYELLSNTKSKYFKSADISEDSTNYCNPCMNKFKY